VSTSSLAATAPPHAPAAVADEPVVRVEQLTKRFGEVVAVDDLSFALERGTVTGFLGPNGPDRHPKPQSARPSRGIRDR
jgi:drug efflux transport system ATP-binding protein